MEIEPNHRFRQRRYPLDNRFHQGTYSARQQSLLYDISSPPTPQSHMRTIAPLITTRDTNLSRVNWEREDDDNDVNYIKSEYTESIDYSTATTTTTTPTSKHSHPNSPLALKEEERVLELTSPLPKTSPPIHTQTRNINISGSCRSSLSPSSSEYSFSIKHILQMEKCPEDRQNESTLISRHSLPPSSRGQSNTTCLPSPDNNEQQYHRHQHHHTYPFHVSQAFAESAYFNTTATTECRTVGCRKCNTNDKPSLSPSTTMHARSRYPSPPLPMPLHPYHNQSRHLDHIFATSMSYKKGMFTQTVHTIFFYTSDNFVRLFSQTWL